MKKTLYLKFCIAYFIFGVFGFIIIAVFVSNLTLEHLRREKADALYREATLIANTYASDLYDNTTSLDAVKKQLDALDTYLSAQVWIINPSGRMILDSSKPVNIQNEVIVENFDRTGASITSLKEDSLISVFDGSNEKYAKIIITPYEPAGHISGISQNEGIVYVDEDMHYADKDFFDIYQMQLKDFNNSALVDFRGRVAAISELHREDRFVWAYLCDIDSKTGLEKEVSIKVYGTDAEMKTFPLKADVILDGEKTPAEDVYEFFTELDLVNGKSIAQDSL